MTNASQAFVAAQLGISVEAMRARRARMPARFLADDADAGECPTCDGTGLGMTEESRCFTCKGSGNKPWPQSYFTGDQEP